MNPRFITLTLLFGFMITTPVHAAAPAKTEIENLYARGVYWPWELTKGNAEASGKEFWQFVDDTMATLENDLHCNVIWFVNGPDDPVRVCKLAEKHQLKVFLGTELMRFFYEGIPGDDRLQAAARKAVADLKDQKALGAYVLKDEARPAEVAHMELVRRLLAAEDPRHPSIVVTMTGDTAALLRAQVTLEPGAGTLLKMEFANEAPGLLLFHEDFSTCNFAVRLENAERQIQMRGFGMGWTWAVHGNATVNQPAAIEVADVSKAGGGAPAAGALGLVAQGEALVYVQAEGYFPKAESLVYRFVDEKGNEGWNKTNNYHLPACLPANTAKVRLVLAPGAMVNSVRMWRIPRKAASK